MNMKKTKEYRRGFTIVELTVVIVVIGILIAVGIVGWGAWRNQVADAAVKSDINGVAAAMKSSQNWDSGFPTLTAGSQFTGGVFTQGDDVTLTYYGGNAKAYCIDAVSKSRPNIQRYLMVDGQSEQTNTGVCSSVAKPSSPTVSSSVSGTTITFTWTAPAPVFKPIIDAQISVNNGAWQTVAVSGSTTAGTGYNQTHTIKVRSGDGQNYSDPVTASASTGPAPASAWTSKGTQMSTGPGCSATVCYYYRLNTSNFAAGTYQVRCFDYFGDFGTVYTVNLPANGYVDLSCYSGSTPVYTQIIGWGNTASTYW